MSCEWIQGKRDSIKLEQLHRDKAGALSGGNLRVFCVLNIDIDSVVCYNPFVKNYIFLNDYEVENRVIIRK